MTTTTKTNDRRNTAILMLDECVTEAREQGWEGETLDYDHTGPDLDHLSNLGFSDDEIRDALSGWRYSHAEEV